MNAIYKGQDIRYVVVEEDGDGVILEHYDGDSDTRVKVLYDDPRLILDPTDNEWFAAERKEK